MESHKAPSRSNRSPMHMHLTDIDHPLYFEEMLDVFGALGCWRGAKSGWT